MNDQIRMANAESGSYMEFYEIFRHSEFCIRHSFGDSDFVILSASIRDLCLEHFLIFSAPQRIARI